MFNTILGFFTNVLASLVTNMISRVPPAFLILIGIVMGAWITYILFRTQVKKEEVGKEATGSAIGDLFADGLEAVGEAAAML
jgi:hypothetical protein